MDPAAVRLDVHLGRLHLANPILVASGTFGYAREMAGLVDLGRLGGILPKTITKGPRAGNPPPRTVETAAGMLNSIGLDNDGIERFIERHLPYLAGLGTKIIVSIAGKTLEEFVDMAARLDGLPGADALELNISCPNVSGGVDFGADPAMCQAVVAGVRRACRLPVIAKLTPNVTSIAAIARAAEAGGADALSLINTCLGLAVDWRRRRPILGRGLGGLSGPAIKPIAVRRRIPGCRSGADSVGGHRRHCHHRRRHGIPGGRRQRGANRHRQLLPPRRLHRVARRPARRPGRTGHRLGGRRGRHPCFPGTCPPCGKAIMRVLSGIQPTGRFHWGNYFGAIRQYIELQDQPANAFYFIANLHALTTVRDPRQLWQNTLDAAVDLLALGLDPQRATLFVQSDVPEVAQLCWLLLSSAPMGLLERCHAYKDKKARGLPPTPACSPIPS